MCNPQKRTFLLGIVNPLFPGSSLRSSSSDMFMKKNVWISLRLHSRYVTKICQSTYLKQFNNVSAYSQYVHMSTFLFRSLLVTSQTLLSTAILNTLIFLFCCCFNVQVSALYNTTDWINVLYSVLYVLYELYAIRENKT